MTPLTPTDIHARLEAATDAYDVGAFEALKARIAKGRATVMAASAGGSSQAVLAPARATLSALEDDLARLDLKQRVPFLIARAMALLADELAEVTLMPEGSVVTAEVLGVIEWVVPLGDDLAPF